MSSLPLGIKCQAHNAAVVDLSFSKVCDSGYYLASAGLDRLAVLRHGDTGDWVGNLTGHVGAVWSVALNKDATRLATGSVDRTARLWDAVTGQELEQISLRRQVSCVALQAQNNFMAVGCLGPKPSVYLYDMNSNEKTPLMKLRGHIRGVRNACFCRNDSGLLTSSYDRTIRMWDCTTGQHTHTIELPHHAKSMELQNDGHTVIIAYGNSLIVLDTTNFAVLKHVKLGFKVTTATLHPLKETFICANDRGLIKKFDYATDYLMDSFSGHEGLGIYCVRYSPDGEVFASSSTTGEVTLWQHTPGKKYGLWDTISSDSSSADADIEDSIS
ncbi:hypothetical protein KR018_006385 [Drosophila ironensis]|nr:hypothetical protein KR018_006385 [Drosophila ironensis]